MKTRIVKKPTVRRDEILDSVGRLIYTKGYEQMTIQDILNDLGIAKGTIYHYFDSKHALLDAFIERIQQETEKVILPILNDPNLTAVGKLQGFFNTLDRFRTANIANVVSLARVWYKDENAIVRQKVNAAVIKQRSPLINEIVRQGVREGVFHTAYPGQSGEIILTLLEGMGNAHINLLFALGQDLDEMTGIEQIIAAHAAYMDAVENVLGAAPNSLSRLTHEDVKPWVAAFKQTA